MYGHEGSPLVISSNHFLNPVRVARNRAPACHDQAGALRLASYDFQVVPVIIASIPVWAILLPARPCPRFGRIRCSNRIEVDGDEAAIAPRSRKVHPTPDGRIVNAMVGCGWIVTDTAASRLSHSDYRRHAEPDYRRGWNSFDPMSAAIEAPRPAHSDQRASAAPHFHLVALGNIAWGCAFKEDVARVEASPARRYQNPYTFNDFLRSFGCAMLLAASQEQYELVQTD